MTGPAGNPPVLSRDQDGNEHLLHVVDHPGGLVSVFDQEIVRILSPTAALELSGRLKPGSSGPVSSTF